VGGKEKKMNKFQSVLQGLKLYIGRNKMILGDSRVISSSLHGIILAESYGIPAVLFLPEATRGNLTLFKYQDYYYGTHRTEFPVARTIEEALAVTPCPVPDLTQQREALLQAFPADLWK
jgi:pyruvyltransferase